VGNGDDGGNVPALEFAGLVKRFGDNVAVDHVDLAVPAGSFFGLVGPNGAGKTTSLSMAVGLLRPDGGTVKIFGRDVCADPVAAKALIGVLPAGMALRLCASPVTAHVRGTGPPKIVRQYWPPLTAATPTAAGLSGKLTAVNDAHGGQVAYHGHLLYTFISDRPGQVTGQGVQDFFVATPGVAPVAGTSAPTETAPATPSGGGYGY
jgi:energy-coupling factor transporter ATP-binding protein EcfA2